MKRLFLLLLLLVPSFAFCQTEEGKYYIYNIVSFEGDLTNENFKVYFDNGLEVKRLRNDKGDKVKFTTPAGVLMYFLSQGWEMYLSGASSNGRTFQGTGVSTTNTYWILRKPCTKKEFEEAAKKAVSQETAEDDVYSN